MKRTLLFLTFMMGMMLASAQTSLQDVVYLKDGSIIRGDIIEMVPEGVVKVMTSDGSLFVYPYAEVERYGKEEPVGIAKNYYTKATAERKSPLVAGLLSFWFPGMGIGQLYNGEIHKAAVDFLTTMGSGVVTAIGLNLVFENTAYEWEYGPDGYTYSSNDDGNAALRTTGYVLMAAGIVAIYGNMIHSICDAVKSAKRINAENGYAMYQFNDRCAFGIQPSIAYECPQYLTGSKPELSAGMKFKLTF